MSKNMWDEEPFNDGAPQFKNGEWMEQETYIPVSDTQIRSRPVSKSQVIEKEIAEIQQEDVYELTEQLSENDDEEDFAEMLSDARLRLEQGKLYEMILNHDLFNGVDVDPRAAKIVQKQIRNFAKESMELMLGMRSTVPAHHVGNEQKNSFPFSNLEVEVLKDLAYMASKGDTKKFEEDQEKKQLAPINSPKKNFFNSIGSSKSTSPKPIQKKVTPIQRQPRPEMPIDPMEPDYEPLKKPIGKMSQSELEERDKQVQERQKNRKAALPEDRAPMPSYEVQEMLAAQQVQKAIGNPRANLSAAIMSAISKNK